MKNQNLMNDHFIDPNHARWSNKPTNWKFYDKMLSIYWLSLPYNHHLYIGLLLRFRVKNKHSRMKQCPNHSKVLLWFLYLDRMNSHTQDAISILVESIIRSSSPPTMKTNWLLKTNSLEVEYNGTKKLIDIEHKNNKQSRNM